MWYHARRMLNFLRTFFHWNYSQLFIGILFGSGVAMITFSHFGPAYIFFAATVCWSLVYWQVSDHLVKKRRELNNASAKFQEKPKQERRKAAYKKALWSYWTANICPSLVIGFVGVGLIMWAYSAQTDWELSQPDAPLLPATDPDPPTSCSSIPSNALRVYMKGQLHWATKFPHTVIGFGNEEELKTQQFEKALVLDRRDTQLLISAKVRGRDSKLLATIDNNEFNINTNNALPTHKPRPDKSTLIVHDQEGNEVLNIRYLNPHSVRITGILYFRGMALNLPLQGFEGGCFGDSIAADVYAGPKP